MDMSTDTITPIAFQPKHLHGLPILQRPNLTPAEKLYWENYNTTTFFTTDLSRPGLLYLHCSLMVITGLIVYPIYLLLNNVDSKWKTWALILNFILNSISIIAITIYNVSFPANKYLYPHNIYHKCCFILFFVIFFHFLTFLILNFNKQKNYQWLQYFINSKQTEVIPDSTKCNNNSSPKCQNNDEIFLMSNLSDNFLQGNENGIGDVSESTVHETTAINSNQENIPSGRNANEAFYTSHNDDSSTKLKGKISILMKIFNCLNVPMLFWIWINNLIGLAIGNLFGMNVRIFNLLAHWIKGGVFIILGVVTISRYFGIGQSYGWSWNNVIIASASKDKDNLWNKLWPKGTITMEFIESFLIFFYGSTNIFLEHLAGHGGAWTTKDLQHVSIAFLYIGAGLCGILLEVYLNDWRYSQIEKLVNKFGYDKIANISNSNGRENASCRDNENADFENVEVSGSIGFSPNPFPALTIFWTGVLMSQHAQASELSTKIHTQWGLMLSYGSLFRIFTFLIIYFKPGTNYSILNDENDISKCLKPRNPITELITSFCLICGGVIFMESTDQVVEALEWRGWTPLFTCNLTVGFTMILMSWLFTLFIFRDQIIKKKKNKDINKIFNINARYSHA